METDDINEAKSPNETAACAVSRAVAGSTSIGPGQYAAAEVWEMFKARDLTFLDLLELAAVIVINVTDKSGSTDKEIHGYLYRLTLDMRENAAAQSESNH